MNNNMENKKFFLYARKSTDVEDKQVLSIDAQLTELREYAARENIEISAEIIEKQSAKIPDRPLFPRLFARGFGGPPPAGRRAVFSPRSRCEIRSNFDS